MTSPIPTFTISVSDARKTTTVPSTILGDFSRTTAEYNATTRLSTFVENTINMGISGGGTDDSVDTVESSSNSTSSSWQSSPNMRTEVSPTSSSSSITMSSLTKMISQWTSTDIAGSETPLSQGDLGVTSPRTTQAYETETPILGHIRETYLQRNRLTLLPHWVNESSSKSLDELPLSLPLTFEEHEIQMDANVTSLYGLFEVNDNCTLNNMTDINGTSCILEEIGLGYNYWALLLIAFSVFAVFGNVLVILSVKRERSLWNVTNYFIVSLAVADLLVAGVVMPFGVYFLFNRTTWALPPIACDFYIAMDVTCSTSSILNLVAISIDRFIAVTQPIKYAKHKSNTRVWLTIVFVWVFSCLVGSPIVLGLNTPPEPVDVSLCTFHNYYFVFFSSLCSFYIPCTILVYLYYRIFKVIRERAKKAAGTGHGKAAGGTVIENLAQTKRLAETTLGGPSSLTLPKSQTVDDEKCTNTGSGSQEEGDDDKDLDDGEGDDDHDGDGDGSPDSADECQIIANNQVAAAFVLESVRNEESFRGTLGRVEQNGNHDSGYAASNMEDGPHPVPQEPSPASPKLSLPPHEPCKRNGLKEEGDKKSSCGESATSSKKPEASRFTICKAHKASRRKKEKSSAKRERKATKTLAIVLGLFLLCWLPFFTCNIMDAICSMLKQQCGPSLTTFLLTTWLGYANSCLNPIIYTIFNQEFRKAFKKILFGGS